MLRSWSLRSAAAAACLRPFRRGAGSFRGQLFKARRIGSFLLLAAAAAKPALAAVGPATPPDDSLAPPPAIGAVLSNAADEALASYPAIKAGRATIRAAYRDLEAARWLRYPSVSVDVVTRHDRIGVSPNLQVIQPLWAGGRISGTIDRAAAARSVAYAQLEETGRDIVLQLTNAYFDFVQATELVGVYEESLGEHRKLVDSMQRRVTQEVSPRADLELARSRAAQVEQDLATARNQKDSALAKIAELVGDPDFEPGSPPAFTDGLYEVGKAGILDQALACDATIHRLQAETKVAEADRKISRASLLPQLGVEYSYDRFEHSQLGLSVRAQTSGGLAPLASAHAAEARRDASQLQVLVAEREVREAVNLDLVENQSANMRVESAREAAESSSNVTDSYLRQFVAGRRTWLDVMNSVRERVSARATLVSVETSAMASSARLMLRSCRWHPFDRLAAAR